MFYGREVVWYFINPNILKSYDFVCNYNIKYEKVIPGDTKMWLLSITQYTQCDGKLAG